MALITENELKKKIKERSLANCCLVYGDEDYLKQFYVTAVCSSYVASGSETFCLRRYDGKENSLDEVLEGALSMPFMGENTVVIARDFPLDSLSAGQKEQLSQYLKNPCDTSVTVFWMDSAQVSAKNPKWKKVIDEFSKYGDAAELQKPAIAQLRRMLPAYAAKCGCTMSGDTAEYLVSVAGDSLSILFNEVKKAAAYAGEGAEVTREHIDKTVSPSLEAKIFDLSRLVLSGDAKGALELLHNLIVQKTDPIDIFGVILMSFTDIYRVKTAVSSGENAVYPAKFYDYKNREFRLKNAARSASKISGESLRECFDCFADADRRLKSTAQSGELILERLIVRLSLILAR